MTQEEWAALAPGDRIRSVLGDVATVVEPEGPDSRGLMGVVIRVDGMPEDELAVLHQAWERIR